MPQNLLKFLNFIYQDLDFFFSCLKATELVKFFFMCQLSSDITHPYTSCEPGVIVDCLHTSLFGAFFILLLPATIAAH